MRGLFPPAYDGETILARRRYIVQATATYKVRAHLSKEGYRQLDDALGLLCEVYNAALDERRYVGKRERRKPERERRYPTYNDQTKQMPAMRREFPELGALSAVACRSPLKHVDYAMAGFLRRLKAGEKPGFPRFRSRSRYNTIDLTNGKQALAEPVNNRWTCKGLPEFRIRPSRTLPEGKPVAARITRSGRRVFVCFVYEVEKTALPPTGCAVGLDMGVANEETGAATITTSDAERISRERRDDRRRKRLQRAVSRAKKGSANRRKKVRRLARESERLAVREHNEAHRITSDLIQRRDFIAVERLQPAKMTRSAKGTKEEPGKNVAAKSGLNREILRQAWGKLHAMLSYKAEWAGRRFVPVNPAYTSQDCSRCGHRNPGKTPNRVYHCRACGHRLNRDVNAAINILRSALATEQGRCAPDAPENGDKPPPQGAVRVEITEAAKPVQLALAF